MGKYNRIIYISFFIIIIIFVSGCIGTQEIQWTKTFEKEESNGGFSVLSTEDGFVIAGYMYNRENNRDFWLLKVDKKGNEIWSRTYNNEYDVASSITNSEDGFIIVGFTTQFPPDQMNVMIIKTDKNGKEKWRKIWGNTERDEVAESVCETDSGSITVGTNVMAKEKAGLLLIKIE